MGAVAEAGERLLAQLFGDGVDAGVGSCLEDERGLAHEFGTPGPARGVRRRDCRIHASVEVAGEVGRPAERDQQLAALDLGQRGRIEFQCGPVQPDTLLVGQASYRLVGGRGSPTCGRLAPPRTAPARPNAE